MSETSKNDFLDLNFDCPLQSSFDDKVVKRWNLQVKKKVKQHDNQDSDRVSVKTMQANEPAQD